MGSRRVGGLGWAGVHGSFIGLDQERIWPTKGRRKKVRKLHPGFDGHSAWDEAKSAGLNRQQWRAQCNRHVSLGQLS